MKISIVLFIVLFGVPMYGKILAQPRAHNGVCVTLNLAQSGNGATVNQVLRYTNVVGSSVDTVDRIAHFHCLYITRTPALWLFRKVDGRIFTKTVLNISNIDWLNVTEATLLIVCASLFVSSISQCRWRLFSIVKIVSIVGIGHLMVDEVLHISWSVIVTHEKIVCLIINRLLPNSHISPAFGTSFLRQNDIIIQIFLHL